MVDDKRRIIELLPEFLQNEQLSKFFNATVDHLFQPERSKKIAGFVGRIPSFFDPDLDFYVVEPTSERQFYQLEPAMSSKNDAGEFIQSQTYPDLVDHLRFQGANVENHSRLFEQEFYSWSPPIDIDKFTNFTNYFWYPEGPSSIQIRGNASNVIDVDADIIGQTSYTSPNAINFTNGMKITFGSNVGPAFYLGKTWIVEGVGVGIKLIDFDELDPDVFPQEFEPDVPAEAKDYITIGRGSTNKNPWSRGNHWYHRDVITFAGPVLVADEEAVLWDADPWDSTPWDAVLTTLVPSINLDQSRQARRPIIEFDRELELFDYGSLNSRQVTVVDTETDDVFSDIQGQPVGSVTINGVTLSDGDIILVTADTNPAVNDRVYLVNDLEVSPGVNEYQLVIQTDGISSDGSPVVGEKVLTLEGDNAGQEFHYTSNEGYILAQRKLSRNQAPLFNLYDSEGVELDDSSVYPESTFAGNTLFSYIEDTGNTTTIDPELGFALTYKNFVQVSEILFEHTLETVTYSFESAPLVREDIIGYYYFHVNADAASNITEEFNNSWRLAPELSSQELDGGFYEIPDNLQANPNFDEVTTVTRSESLAHFGSIISNQDGISGQIFTNTNYRDLAKDRSLGTEILQHRAPLLKIMLSSADENLDIMLALRFSQNEYIRFYNKFRKRIKIFLDDGFTLEDKPASEWLEDAFSIINTAKEIGTFPFGRVRMLPHEENFTSTTFTATAGQTTFAMSTIFDADQTSGTSQMLVYVNNVLQLIDHDYNVTSTDVVFTSGLVAGDVVEIRHYDTVDRAFVPPTAAAMGITRLYKPEIFIDTTYTVPRPAIQGHDGSITLAYGDDRDNVLLELEKRIYNTARAKFRGDEFLVWDQNEVRPGKFRDVGYTQEEWNEVLTPIFTTWATNAGIRWTENTTANATDWQTWNWSGVLDTIDSEPLFGSWRAIFVYFYDTDRPHTHPWEMLGFSEEPSWWVTEYGTDYGSNNTAMWTDLENGVIRQGPRAGTNSLYARPGLSDIIPVSDGGALIDPVTIGIANTEPNLDQRFADWAVGDRSPAETALWRSPEVSFVLSQIGYLMRPSKFVEINWDTEELDFATIDSTQLVNERFLRRPQHDELQVAGELDSNGNVIRRQGVQQWISNRLTWLNLDIESTFGDQLRGLNANLGWKAAGFLKKENLRFIADSFSPGSTANTQKIFIENDDLSVLPFSSSSIKEAIYSGVLIEWTGTGYAVFGYDVLNPFFTIIPAAENSKTIPITVADVTVAEKRRGQFETVQEIPYGFEFTSRQELYDFLISYQRYLENEGWVFDEYDPSTNEILNFRFSGKEFLFWSQDDLDPGAFITLSPLANQARFKQATGLVQNVEEFIRGTYTILDRSGQPIRPRDVTTVRNNDELVVKPNNQQGLYALRLSVITLEHIVLLENVTRFNDTVYLPLFNRRQARLKANGTGVDDWNGRLDVPGFILDIPTASDLIPNFEKTASDFRRFHSIENPSEDDTITDAARHLIGYQRRDYLDSLLIDRDTQYQFYQGFLQQKGSPNVLDRLFRSNAITTSNDVQFFEEWAFRIGEYGGLSFREPLEFSLLRKDIKTNPVLFQFIRGLVSDVDTDNIIQILPNDERWTMRPSKDRETFELRDKNTFFKKDLPNAGFVKLGETDFLAVNPEAVLDEEGTVFGATVGQTVWVAQDNNRLLTGDWDVLRLEQFNSSILWFSDENNNQIIKSFIKDTYTGDGVTQVFETTSSINLVSENIIVKLDGEETAEFTIQGNKGVLFNTAPDSGASVEIIAPENHGWTINQVLVYVENPDGTREASIIESFDNTSITLDDNFEVETIFEEATLLYWESRRSAGGQLPGNLFDPTLFEDQIYYFDQSVNQDGWEVWRSNGTVWRLLRAEEKLVDTSLVSNAVVFDDESNRITGRSTVFDPFKGFIPGITDAEITFKLPYDPAKYTNGPEDIVLNEQMAWGKNQVGRIWWDVSQVRYIWYEMEDLEYRYQNWGKIFPGTEIKVYEWVRSPVPPEDWEDFVAESSEEFDFDVGGTVKDIDTDDGPSWVEREEKDRQSNVSKIFYYFWVEDKTSVPNLPFRTISISDIERTIKDPLNENVSYISPIRDDAFIVSNIENQVKEENTVLQVNFNTTCCDVPVHRQWVLLRENDDFSNIPDRLWNKMRDSLAGFDGLGKEVPDIDLRGSSKFGNFIRPRQTWFEDRLQARRIFVDAFNEFIESIDLVGTNPNFDVNLNRETELEIEENVIDGTAANPTISSGSQMTINGETVIFSGLNGLSGITDDINQQISDPNFVAEIFYVGVDAFIRFRNTIGQDINLLNTVASPVTDLGMPEGLTEGNGVDFVVATRAERDALAGVTIGDKVFVENDENFNGFWSLWERISATGSRKWLLLEIQSFKTNAFWDFIDWFDAGFGPDTEINSTFATLADRNNSNAVEGEVARVEDDGSGKWVLAIFENGVWRTVGKEDATIELSDLLYDAEKAQWGFDQELFDTKPFDDVPLIEMKDIIDAIRNDILVDQFEIQQNVLFFKMVRYVHTEQELVDWVFKTSFIFIVGFTEDLAQKPIFENDGFEALVNFVQEAKPYHTKIKDIIRTFANALDTVDLKVFDYDKPPFDDPDDDSTDTVILDETDSDDLFFMQQNEPWSFWADEFEKDLRPTVPRANNVRKITTRVAFDRISAIKEDYVPSVKFDEFPDFFEPTPFYKSSDTANATNTIENPEYKLLQAFDGTTGDEDNLAVFRFRPNNDKITVTASGDFGNGSTIVIEGGDESDFSGTNTSLVTITAPGTFEIDYMDIEDTSPFIRANTTGYVSGDSITVTLTTTYFSALTRVLRDYSPGPTLPSLLEVITSEFLGTFVDGFNAAFQEGWDGTPWDFLSWDTNELGVEQFLDLEISGGAYFNYEGDGTTGTFPMPLPGVGLPPWQVFVTDLTADPLEPLLTEESVHWELINDGQDLRLLSNPLFTWETGGNLNSGWALGILDSTIIANDAASTVIEGNKFTQPHDEGWPEEMVPLKMNNATVLTVVTSGSVNITLLENVKQVVDGDVVTFDDKEPITFTFSGISGDTVLLEGSDTGAFAGEETLISTVTVDGSVTASGATAFTFYRARVTVYGSGNITVVGGIDAAPKMFKQIINYRFGDPTTFEIGQNVEEVDDLLVTLNGVLLIETTDYTVDTVGNTITVTASLSPGDEIVITSWDATNILNTDPTFFTASYTGSALDLTNFGGAGQDVKPGPTQPLENGIFVFADTGSGFRRLSPPEASYYTMDGTENEVTVLPGQFSLGAGNIEVFLNDALQTGGGTDYNYIEGFETNPEVTITAVGSGYTIGDALTATGGTGTAATFEVILVAPIDTQDETNYDGAGSNGTFAGGSGYAVSDTITLSDLTVITVDAVSAGVVTQFTVNSTATIGVNSNGATLAQQTTSGSGTGFSITLGTANEGVNALKTTNGGAYTARPTSPQTPTGGTGSSLTVTFDKYEQIDDSIQFVTTPVAEDRVAISVITGVEEYTITGDNIDFPGFASATIGILAFKSDDSLSEIQTVTYPGNTTAEELDPDRFPYHIYHRPIGKDFTFVTQDASGAPVGGEEIVKNLYFLEDGAGWDAIGWDDTFSGGWDNHEGSRIDLSFSVPTADRVVISTFAGQPIFATVTYRELVGYDTAPLDTYREFVRFSDNKKTTLTTILRTTGNEIFVTDASIFPAVNGVVYINGERIAYLSRTGGATPGASGSLVGLARGSKGTRKTQDHPVGSVVRPADESVQIPNMEFNMPNDSGKRLQISDNISGSFISEETGGYKTFS